MKVYIIMKHHYPEKVFTTFEKAKDFLRPQVEKFLNRVCEGDTNMISDFMEFFEKDGYIEDFCNIVSFEAE